MHGGSDLDGGLELRGCLALRSCSHSSISEENHAKNVRAHDTARILWLQVSAEHDMWEEKTRRWRGDGGGTRSVMKCWTSGRSVVGIEEEEEEEAEKRAEGWWQLWQHQACPPSTRINLSLRTGCAFLHRVWHSCASLCKWLSHQYGPIPFAANQQHLFWLTKTLPFIHLPQLICHILHHYGEESLILYALNHKSARESVAT